MKNIFNATWKEEADMDDERPDMSKRPPREWAWLAKLSGELMGEVFKWQAQKDELLDELDYVLSAFDRLNTPVPVLDYPAHLQDQQFVVHPPTPPRGATHPKNPLPPKWADLLPDVTKMQGDIPVLKLECDRLIFQITTLKEIAVAIARQQPQPAPMLLLPALNVVGLLPAPKVEDYWLIDSVGIFSFPQPKTHAELSPERAKLFTHRTMRASLGVDRKARAQKIRNSGGEYPRAKSKSDTHVLADLHGVWLPDSPTIIQRPTATDAQKFLLAVVKYYTVNQTMLSQTDSFWLHELGAANITYAIEKGWLKVIAAGKLIVTIAGHELIAYSYEADLPKIKDLHQKRWDEQIADAKKATEVDEVPNMRRAQYRGGSQVTAHRDAQAVARKLYEAGMWDGKEFILIVDGTAILSAVNRGCDIRTVRVGVEAQTKTFYLSADMLTELKKPLSPKTAYRVPSQLANRAVSSARF